MRRIDIVRHPTEGERDALVAFIEDLTDRQDTRPLSDHLWLDLRTGGAPGFVATVAFETCDRGHSIIALAQISSANDASALEVVVDAERLVDDADAVTVDLVETAVDAFASGGGGRLGWWVDDPTDEEGAVAGRLGLRPDRQLFEMRRTLPADRAASVSTRAFVPGVDDEAWLAVNNRAFADHGEQGGWTHETLKSRVAEPWFDPEGFRIHERDGRLAAFCWTKLHRDQQPVVGEIYVIAVDPDFHGQGLGRELTLAGLDSMVARGVTVASLFVDAANAHALSLYERLGFHRHRARSAFIGDIDPQRSTP